MDLYLVVGNPNTRKASVVRSLTGCFNRSVRDIQPLGGKPLLRLYARVGTLQDSRSAPADFIAEAARMRCNAVLCCLAAFKAAGWRICSIAVLGQNGGGVRSPNLLQFPQAPVAPINQTARAVRAHFGWE